MGTRAALTVEEYLKTSFPGLDKEYRDGELVERSLPDYLHGRTQFLIAAFFAAIWRKMSLHVALETRVKLRDGMYLIPDVAVFHPVAPTEQVPSSPPLIAMEILSQDDRMTMVREKLQSYRIWGVAHVWLVDPRSRAMFVFDDRGLREVAELSVPELEIAIRPKDIFE